MAKKVEKRNTSCIVDNGYLITEFGDEIEVKQTYISRKNVKMYRESQKALSSDINSVNLIRYQTEYKDADEDRKVELTELIKECTSKIDEKYNTLNNSIKLVIASIEGTKFKKGAFIVNGKEEEITIDDFDDLPNALIEHLIMNAFKLISVQDDEEKN